MTIPQGCDGSPAEQGPTLAEKLRRGFLTTSQLRRLPKPTWTVDDILSKPSVAMLYGPPGIYKTFVALSWGLCVATDTPWEGASLYRVDAGPVIYVAAEGAYGLTPRIDAWESWYQSTAKNVRWCPGPINLMSATQVDAFIQVARDDQPALVVFDTLARCMTGGDENSAKDVGIAVENLGHISRQLDATALVVHHSRKDGSGYRGSSAMEGAVDTNIEMSRSGTTVTLMCHKQKNAAPFVSIELEAFEVAGSCAMRGVAQGGSVPPRGDTLIDLLCQMSATGAVPTATLREAAGEDLEIPKRSYYRIMASLVSKGFVENIGSDKRPLLMPTALGLALSRARCATPVPDADGTDKGRVPPSPLSIERGSGTTRGTNNGATKESTLESSYEDLL